jgi:hypothetical protein
VEKTDTGLHSSMNDDFMTSLEKLINKAYKPFFCTKESVAKSRKDDLNENNQVAVKL